MLADQSDRNAALRERYSRSEADQTCPDYDYLSAQRVRASHFLSWNCPARCIVGITVTASENVMLRAIFMIGLFAMLGLFAVGMVFKLFGGLVGLTFFIIGLAIKVVIVGGLLYFGIRVLSPGTAERLREKFAGTRLTRY
jgi:hypothetical protein